MAAPSLIIDYPTLTFKEKLREHIVALPNQTKLYLFNLFPLAQWVHRYNLTWLLQDAIAGITVGMLMVPQGIAYAKIANLDPQYGLYTSFVGATLYCFFGTSKDISIGPITVVSLLVGQAITKVQETHPNISGPEVAVCLSLFSGLVLVCISLIRLGILVDFISEPAIAGYMTGSAITISMGQWPKVFGLSHVNTHDSPYLIFYQFFEQLKNTKLDAAFGLTALVALYAIKIGGAKLSARVPALKKPLFYLGIMRSGLIVILGTLISYIVNLQHRTDPVIRIIKNVPSGFDAMAVPSFHFTILKEASDVLPPIILILILEHVSVAKSFGSMSNYTINPNQEILAIGISNIVGSFFGAYPCTGAFSRTAVMSRSGAKTPMAGVFSGAVVVLALYALTPAFYYIPEAVLGSVVIHAVIDLISGPNFMKKLWKTSVLEFMIFAIAVIVTCFLDVETAIYIAIGLSLFLMLLRLARPQVVSMGRVKLTDCQLPPLTATSSSSGSETVYHNSMIDEGMYGVDIGASYIYVNEKDPNFSHILDPVLPGVVVIQLSNSMLYPNSAYVSECITQIVKLKTRPGREDTDSIQKKQEVLWNEPIADKLELQRKNKPCLSCLVIDLSAVGVLDATALHNLNVLKKALDIYAGGRSIEWHFCHASPGVRQLLIESGFGFLPEDTASETVTSALQNDQKKSSNALQDLSKSIVNDNIVEIDPYYHHHKEHYIIESLPRDKYPAFHWNIDSAVHSIGLRYQKQQLNNPSSFSVTIY